MKDLELEKELTKVTKKLNVKKLKEKTEKREYAPRTRNNVFIQDLLFDSDKKIKQRRSKQINNATDLRRAITQDINNMELINLNILTMREYYELMRTKAMLYDKLQNAINSDNEKELLELREEVAVIKEQLESKYVN